MLALKEALIQAKQWNSDVDTLNAADHYPYLDALEELVNKGRPIPVRLEFLSQVSHNFLSLLLFILSFGFIYTNIVHVCLLNSCS